MEAKLFSQSGAEVGTIQIDEYIFGIDPNVPVMHQAVVRQNANARMGTHNTLGRGEVAGSTRKLYRQKGTGRARQGSTRAAQWRGGGIIFGPTPRSYEQKMPRQMRHAALRSALTVKAMEERVVVLDSLTATETAKTREMAASLKLVAPAGRALILLADRNENVERVASNIADVKLLRAGYLNMRDLLDADYIVIPQDALTVLEGILG